MATTATFTATFTSVGTDTWVAPTGVSSASTECFAGGGEGGSSSGSNNAGGGGGGGEYAAELNNTVTAGNSYTIVVGTGTGASAGGNSSFTGTGATTVTANGGTNGSGNNGVNGTGGTGSTNTVHHNGGNGGVGITAQGSSSAGGGGGSSAGPASAGNSGGSASSGTGGTGASAVTGGGAGGNGSTSSGANASSPGGGGGGAGGLSGVGGNGGAGKVVVTWVMSSPAVLSASTAGGTYTWTAPAGITTASWTISGTASFDGNTSSGSEAVTPGNSYTISVGSSSSLTITFSLSNAPDFPIALPGPTWLRYFKPGMPRTRPLAPPSDRNAATDIPNTFDIPATNPGPAWLAHFRPGAHKQMPFIPVGLPFNRTISGSMALPEMGMSGSALSGSVVGSGSMALPPMAFSGTAHKGTKTSGSVALPEMAMAGTDIESFITTGSAALRTMSMAGTCKVQYQIPPGIVQLKVELLINGTWTDITDFVYSRNPAVITRGRPDEGSQGTQTPSQMTLTLNNRDGRFSSSYPAGAYYPYLTRNTQMRISAPATQPPPYSLAYRFWGEVAEWPPGWDPTGTDVYVNVTVSGIFRRLAQSAALRSSFYRYITTLASAPIAYWPCEDGATATQLGNWVQGGQAMLWTGSPTLASDSAFACSAPIPAMNSAVFSGNTGVSGALPVASSAVFTSGSGTWTAPAGVTSVLVTATGGGGGGGNYNGTTGGGGGGGGEYAQDSVSVTPGTGYAYSVGAAGGVQSAGGNTTFHSTSVVAHGGSGGDNAGNGGAGGTGSSNTTHFDGGTGANGSGGPGGSGSSTSNSQLFNSAGATSWNAPSALSGGKVTAYLWGAGGGGGGGAGAGGASGGGGAGGNFWSQSIGVTAGNSYSLTVGTGGAGGGGDQSGGNGTASQFVGDSTTFTIHGGFGGVHGSAGGAGGTHGSDSSANFGGSGGRGASGSTVGGAGGGGGGGASGGGNTGGRPSGSSGGAIGTGDAGVENTEFTGVGDGNGGRGGTYGPGPGQVGAPAGGGGGGGSAGSSNSNGGGGGAGAVYLFWNESTPAPAAAVGGGGGSSGGSSSAGNAGATQAGGAAVTGGGPGGGTLVGSTWTAAPSATPGGGGGGYDSDGAAAFGASGLLVLSWAPSGGGSSGTQANVVRYLLQVPSGGDTDGAVISRFYTTGTISYCDVIYNQANGGELTLTGFTGAGATLFTTGAAITAINGLLLEVSVELQVSGGNITYQLAALKAGGTTYYATGSGTLTSASMGLPFVIYMNNSGSLTSTAFGHVQVYSTYSSLLNDAAALAAHAGETAAARINRLGTEQGISTNVIDAGASDTTILMGPQLPEKLITLLQECEDADRGLIYEPRGSFGIEYRTRASLYSQTPAYSLSYPGGQVAQPLAPTEDDQLTRNDVTVSRTSGSSFEDTLTSGPLSIQDPPNGVGQYSFSLTANVLDDGLLPDLASWILWVGTQSDLRYPTIAVDLFRSEMLYEFNGIVSADLGDFMQVVSPPFWLPPGPISQLVYGYTETLAQFTWTIVSNCVPEIPYEVGVANTSRTDTDGSILHTGIGTTSTSFSVDTPVPSAVWVDSSGHAGEFPFDIVIDGERMVVTAISGTTTPQVFTVTRGVDGVTTAHNAGAMVNVYRPAVTGM